MGNRPAPTGCKFSPSVACGDSSLVRGSQGDGGTTGARDLPPPLPPLRGTKAGGLPLRPSSKNKRVYGRNMVPPVRSRAARFAVPPGVSAETPAIERGGAERMRSGGVVGRVQEKVTCDRKPVPTRCPQPLSQTLRVCQLPLHRGAKPSGDGDAAYPAQKIGFSAILPRTRVRGAFVLRKWKGDCCAASFAQQSLLISAFC